MCQHALRCILDTHCIFLCLFRAPDSRNFRPQSWHWKGRESVCLLSWRTREPLVLNEYVQLGKVQTYCLLSAWVFMWAFRLRLYQTTRRLRIIHMYIERSRRSFPSASMSQLSNATKTYLLEPFVADFTHQMFFSTCSCFSGNRFTSVTGVKLLHVCWNNQQYRICYTATRSMPQCIINTSAYILNFSRLHNKCLGIIWYGINLLVCHKLIKM